MGPGLGGSPTFGGRAFRDRSTLLKERFVPPQVEGPSLEDTSAMRCSCVHTGYGCPIKGMRLMGCMEDTRLPHLLELAQAQLAIGLLGGGIHEGDGQLLHLALQVLIEALQAQAFIPPVRQLVGLLLLQPHDLLLLLRNLVLHKHAMTCQLGVAHMVHQTEQSRSARGKAGHTPQKHSAGELNAGSMKV